jgi:arabinofuranosyltransferase
MTPVSCATGRRRWHDATRMSEVTGAGSQSEARSAEARIVLFVALRCHGNEVAALPATLLLLMAIRQRWVADDGFIYLRVVRNVVEGHGPVFNVGDRVEAFTSPLWVALLALTTSLGLRAEPTAVGLGIALTVGALLCAQIAAVRLHAPAGTTEPRPPWMLPLGATVVAALPPYWDFASSGLEIGLTLFWLAASYLVVVTLAMNARPLGRAHFFAAALVGVGPLVRPELVLYSMAYFVPLARAFVAEPSRKRSRSIVALMATALVLPLAYQLFRMGYFAALTANTAIAKEAFAFNVEQGVLYAKDFFGRYHLLIPLLAIALAVHSRMPRRVVMLAPVVAASMHVLYVVVTGGDFMHARLFLPCLFAALLPVSMVAPPRERSSRTTFALFMASAAIVFGWAGFPRQWHAARVDGGGIFDERVWYARRAKTRTPVAIGDYAGQEFFKDGEALLARVSGGCPDPIHPCRFALLGENTGYGVLEPRPASLTITPRIDPSIVAVADASAIGITGYVLPSTFHVVDHLGLADAVASRLEVRERGRPGHEKSLSNAWVLARWSAGSAATDPTWVEDGSVTAARRALACAPLERLERATRAPLSLGLFAENLGNAFRLQWLRIPSDPAVAEARLCGAAEPASFMTTGTGGEAFAWRCPDGMLLSGLNGSMDAGARAIASLRPYCSDRLLGTTVGPTFGEATRDTFDRSCASQAVIGIEGHQTGSFVSDVAMLCEGKASAPPPDRSASFRWACPAGSVAVGVRGRAGALIDAVGLVCAPIGR